MLKVRLYTNLATTDLDGGVAPQGYVTSGELVPFITPPTVLLWGLRVFTLHEPSLRAWQSDGEPLAYVEAFTVSLIGGDVEEGLVGT